MVQSMSRVVTVLTIALWKFFGGILKRERYGGSRFTSQQELVQMIVNYIRYYTTRRVQCTLGVLTPLEKHELCLAA